MNQKHPRPLTELIEEKNGDNKIAPIKIRFPAGSLTGNNFGSKTKHA